MDKEHLLESSFRHGISDWLNENSFTYNFSDFCHLKRRLMSVTSEHTPVEDLRRLIENTITVWRLDYKTGHTFDHWDVLGDDLVDRCEHRIREYHRGEALRHAS